MRTLVLLPLVLFALGCSSSATDSAPERIAPLRSAEGIVFTVERSSYQRGEPVTVILRNQTDEHLGYNLCVASREMRTGGGWTRISPLRACTMEIRGLAPGAETSSQERTDDLRPGEYRIVTVVERSRSRDRGEIYTPVFRIER